MAWSGHTLVKLEEKVLEFEFQLFNVQYNKSGNFFLKLSIQNAHRQDLLAKTTVEVNDSGVSRPGNEITTNTVQWNENSTTVSYEQKQFKFKFPAGFCKNDGMHDVHLLIEAYRLSPQPKRKREVEKMGEAKFAIYPRTEIPKANLFAKKGEDYYNYSDVLTLLRPLTRASMSLHCGRIAFNAAFHEYREPGHVFEEVDDEESQLSPVPEEESTKQQTNRTLEEPDTIDARKEAIKKINKRDSPPFSPPIFIEQVQSMDRMTQWTPQTEYFDSPGPVTEEGSFHISLPPSPPLPEDSNHPTNRETWRHIPGSNRNSLSLMYSYP